MNELMAALGSVGPWMLLEDLAAWTSLVDCHIAPKNNECPVKTDYLQKEMHLNITIDFQGSFVSFPGGVG